MLAFFEGLEGYSRVRYLTKIRCGNRENDKYLDGTRDLTAPQEAGLAKNRGRDTGFFWPVCREFGEIVASQINVIAAQENQPAFVEIRLFNEFFWERKTGFGIVRKKVRDA